MTYTFAIFSTLAAWFIGLFADANIDFGDPQGFSCFGNGDLYSESY